jgi:hypothetical protein
MGIIGVTRTNNFRKSIKSSFANGKKRPTDQIKSSKNPVVACGRRLFHPLAKIFSLTPAGIAEH